VTDADPRHMPLYGSRGPFEDLIVLHSEWCSAPPQSGWGRLAVQPCQGERPVT
ncbi:unnamed protein product, partial [Arctogadus glacialis]